MSYHEEEADGGMVSLAGSEPAAPLVMVPPTTTTTPPLALPPQRPQW